MRICYLPLSGLHFPNIIVMIVIRAVCFMSLKGQRWKNEKIILGAK